MMYTNKRAIISCIVITAIVLCCLTFFAGCSSQISDNNENNNSTDVNNTDINNTDKVQEISSGLGETSSKELPSQRIGTKCLSFYPSGEIIKVTSFMGDMYDYGETPTYDTYGTNGYPIFEVYPCEGVPSTYNESSAVKINSAFGKYEKVFSKDDMVSLNYPNYPHNFLDEECHSEITELDFSQCRIGDSGEIALSFGWHYDFPRYDGAMMFDGMRNFLGYYIGEDGVYLSFNGAETAKNQYESNKNDAAEIGHLPNNKYCSAKPLYLTWVDNAGAAHLHGTVIQKQFEITSLLDYSEYSVSISVDNGIELVSESQMTVDLNVSNAVPVYFRLTDNATFGEITIEISSVDTNNETDYLCKRSIFYCYEDGYDYINTNSLDSLAEHSTAISELIDSLNRQGERTEIDEISLGNLNSASATVQSTSIFVSGHIKWRDNVGRKHVAEGVTVNICDYGTVIGSAITDINGYYSKTVPYTGTDRNISITVYTSGTNVTVTSPNGITYSDIADETYIVSGGESAYIPYTFKKDTDVGKAASVHQAMALASRYVYSLEGEYLDNIFVSFPDDSQDTTCYCSDGKIYVLSGDAFDWDVLEHEYGHYVQDCFNIENSPGYAHTSTSNLAEVYGKSNGVRLAWGEGWATYFALNLQNQMSAAELNIPYVGDTFYQDYEDNYLDYSIEFLPNERNKGEANEASVAAILFDITDPTGSTDFDYVYCADNNVWDIIVSNNCTTLSEFISEFYLSSFSQSTKLALGSILSNYNVAAKLEAPTIDATTVTPTFTWTNYDGGDVLSNNQFRLAFYDSSYNLIFRTSFTTAESQALSESQWNQINNYDSVVYCCVETLQNNSPQTGPYYSNLIQLSNSSSSIYKITNVGAGKCLNIYGDNVVAHYANQNVCLWSDSGSNEQKWNITNIGNDTYVLSIIDSSYGLNVYRVGSQWNCDLYPVIGNETDASIDLIVSGDSYKIKLHNYDLYLTAEGAYDGANVYWGAESSSTYQLWNFTLVQ